MLKGMEGEKEKKKKKKSKQFHFDLLNKKLKLFSCNQFLVQSILVISTSLGPYKKCRGIRKST